MDIKEYKRGVLTMAVGHTKYADMAVDMALSYTQFHNDPISILVDLSSKIYIEKEYPKVFEHLILIPQIYLGERFRKFTCGQLSPYRHTIFLDADIILLGSIKQFWNDGIHSSVLVIGEYLDKNKNRIHHGFSTTKLIERHGLNRYLKVNSGCFYFNKTTSQDFFMECIETHKKLLQDSYINKNGFLGDEISIGLVGSKYNVTCFSHPSPMMWEQELKTLNLKNCTKPICHFIYPIPKKALNSIIRNQIKLRKKLKINESGTIAWKKLNNKRKQAVKKAPLFQRIFKKLNKIF